MGQSWQITHWHDFRFRLCFCQTSEEDNAETHILIITYLGISFSSGGSFQHTFDYRGGQALKAVFALKQYLTVFKHITISHTLEPAYYIL